jgi:hypothetical protein
VAQQTDLVKQGNCHWICLLVAVRNVFHSHAHTPPVSAACQQEVARCCICASAARGLDVDTILHAAAHYSHIIQHAHHHPPRALPHAVRTCDGCYLKSTAWDATRSYDVFGQSGDKAVVLVHAALVGRHSLVLEAKALAEVGFRWVSKLHNSMHKACRLACSKDWLGKPAQLALMSVSPNSSPAVETVPPCTTHPPSACCRSTTSCPCYASVVCLHRG